MFSKVKSGIITGIMGTVIEIETDVNTGLPNFTIVGLAGTEVKESKERVKSAIENSGYVFPKKNIVINLSPADLKKDGSYLDLGICMGILRSKISKDEKYMESTVFLGELSLNGEVRHMNAILAIVLSLSGAGIKRVFIPFDNYAECCEIDNLLVIPVRNIKECIGFVNMSDEKVKKYVENSYENIFQNCEESDDGDEIIENDFINIRGNAIAKRCAEICVAGNHNMLMIGPPGSGKSMIARAMKTILPKPDKDEQIEITRIYSAAGKLMEKSGLVAKRPYRSPHHTATKISLIGGGRSADIGEITLAHKGILFLDEIPEFKRDTLESLRQPIEDRFVNITRVNNTVTYPSDFILLATMNPCPCGYYRSDRNCICKVSEIDRYTRRLSGPILDRIDIICEVAEMEYSEFSRPVSGSRTSKMIRKDMERARRIQKERFKGTGISTNGEMSSKEVFLYSNLTESAKSFGEQIYRKYNLSNRSYINIVKTARTIADLAEKTYVDERCITEAFYMRKAYYKYFEREN